MASIGLGVDTSGLDLTSKEIERISLEVIKGSGEKFIELHLIRTKKGLDVNDSRMPDVSAFTAKKVGRTTRTLDDTGQMLRAMVARRPQGRGSKVSIVVGIFNGKQARKARKNQDRYPWFGPSPQLVRRLQRWQQKDFDKRVEAMNRR